MNGQIRDIEEALQWAEFIRQAGACPPHLSVQQAAAAILAGRELGIPPIQSLRAISIIQGQIALSVQAQLALAHRAGVKIADLEEAENYCTVTLSRGDERVTATFSLEDAKRAGLGGRSWEKYPRLMLRARAIGSALRLIAPDVVLGLLSPEEAQAIAEEMPESLPEAEAVEPIAEDIPGYLPDEPPESIAEALQEEPEDAFAESLPEPPPEEEAGESIPESPPNDDEPRESAGGGLIDKERRKLIGRIHGLKKWLGWSDEIYREWLRGRFGVDSSKQLRIEQLMQAAKELEQETREEVILRLGNLHPDWGNPEVARLFTKVANSLFDGAHPLKLISSAQSAQDLMNLVWERMSHPQKFSTGKWLPQMTPDDFELILRKALS